MIRNIHLVNWRAYRELNLSLTRPVTFFVAPNGVGKTSLVEAVRWGLLGTPDIRDRGRAVRGGQESATVRLNLSLPGYTDIQVTRSLKRNGAATFEALADGATIDEARYHMILRESWSADPSLLDALIFEPIVTSKSTGFPIRDHLANVFGIQPLLDAASRLRTRRAELGVKIKSLREDLSGTDDAIAAAGQALATLEADVGTTAAERRAAAEEVGELDTATALAASWERYRHEAQVYSDRIRSLAAEMADVLDVGDQDPRIAIADGEREAAAAVEDSIAVKAAAEVQAAAAASAAELLASAAGSCPTCLRPLTDDERDVALASHGDTGGDARTEIERHEHETVAARRRLEAISQFGRTLNELRAPVEPESDDPGPDAMTALADARQRASNLTERHGALNAQLEAARRTLADLRRVAADQSTLLAAAREDLVAEVTEKTLNTVADRYLAERIEPLTHQIGRRWKLVFGSEGLQLGSDGQLSFSHGDVDLMLSDLSGGERATALLVTRLLLAGSVARASTIWFDEPLEHLDPRRRAAIARTIALAAQAGAVGQILVTTYEEGLVRRLAATMPDTVELTYARADQERL
ncbi:MAG: AAA family ATPase [Pseudonocardiaceae bacterium]